MSKRADVVSTGIFEPILNLTLMCDSVTLLPKEPLMAAVTGPGPCLHNVIPQDLGLTHARPTHSQLKTMVYVALERAQYSIATREMPPLCEGVEAVQLVATFFLWSMETPFPLYLSPFPLPHSPFATLPHPHALPQLPLHYLPTQR